MSKPEFVYVTYIETTAEKLWHALTDSDFHERYWFGHRAISDWKVGSTYRFDKQGKPSVEGKVLESDPPRRLVTSWAPPSEPDNPAKTSRVAIDIEDLNGKVRLTVTHTDLDAQGLKDVSGGWPAVLSNLKTLLETGRTLPDPYGAVEGHPES